MEAKTPLIYCCSPQTQRTVYFKGLSITEPMVSLLDWLWGPEIQQYQLWGLEKVNIVAHQSGTELAQLFATFLSSSGPR